MKEKPVRSRIWLAVMVLVAAVGCSAESTTVALAPETSTPTTTPMDTTTSVATTAATVPPGPPSGTVAEAGPGRYDIAYDHAALGPMTISVFAGGDNGQASVTATDATGGVVYQYEATNLLELAPARLRDAEANPGTWAATDTTTNVFIEYNPGRYNGVMILIPTTTGFTAGATEPTESSQGRFYSASIVDQGGDGAFEISQLSNDCNPSCGGGNITATIFHWNGSDYVEGATSGAAGGTADQISVDALGPVSLGMTISEIEGRGYRVSEPGCSDLRFITGGPGVISTHFDGDVLRDATTGDPAYVTLSGIRVGSSASDVHAAYGANAQDTTLMGDSGPFPAIVLRSPQASEAGRTLWFYIDDGAVGAIVLVPYDTTPFPGC